MEEQPLIKWFKSSYSNSNGGNCVEVAELPNGMIGIRDSKHPEAGHLTVTREEFREFIESLKGTETAP